MRIVFIGASATAVLTTRLLLDEGHDVVIVERDGAKIEALCDELDCGFVHDDGSKPRVLKELSPENTDILFCLTDSDRDNIIASLVAKNIGFERIVTSLEDPEYESITQDIEFAETIVPDREVARALMDMVSGSPRMELSALLKSNLRFFTFCVGEDDATTVSALDLPEEARVVAVTRAEESLLAEDSTELEPGDVVVIICAEELAGELEERFAKE